MLNQLKICVFTKKNEELNGFGVFVYFNIVLCICIIKYYLRVVKLSNLTGNRHIEDHN